MRKHARSLLVLAASVAVLSLFVRPLDAQAALSAADIEKFAGAWALGLDTPQGSMAMNLTLKGADGKLSGQLTSDMQPDAQAITDIAKEGENLVMKYQLDFQGQAIPAIITLSPVGAKWKANFDFAGGQFNVDGTASKK